MADKDDPSRDFNPKHRIVGAIILVALAVIFVPMILSERAPERPDAQLAEVPAPDTQIVVAPVAPPPPEDPSEPVKTIPPMMPVQPSIPEPVAETPPAAEPAAKPAPAPKPAPVAPATAKPKPAPALAVGYVVQLGAFSDTDNAKRLEARLREHGYSPTLDSVKVDGKRATRVRVGPYRNKDEASNVQARIQKEIGNKGVVLSYP